MIHSRLALLLLVAACSAEAPAPPPAPKVKAKPVADADLLPVYAVAVDKGGLLLTDPGTKIAKPAAFGLRQSLILGILARTLGPAQEGHDKSCDRDFARWPNGLTLWFDAGDFTGWTLKDGDTVGIAPGLVRTPAMSAGAACRQTS